MEDTTSQLVEINDDIPEIPNYMRERNISTYTATVFTTIIVFCAMISLIVNIKRKSTKRIVWSIFLPIIAITISKLLQRIVLWNVLTNGVEASSAIFIIITFIILFIILLMLAIMIFKKTNKKNK